MRDALVRGDLAAAISEASEIPRVEPADALDFVLLMAIRDYKSFGPSLTRWIERLEQERPSNAEDRAVALVALRAIHGGHRDLRQLSERLEIGEVVGLKHW